MATINDIVNLDSRKGDIAAGGGDAGAFQIDTKPLQTLGLYTNYYNNTVYNQTVKDRDTKLQEIAKVSAIDANNLFGKDKDFLVNKLNNLKQLAVGYAKNPNLTIDDQLKWQTALSDVNNDYQSGKGRALSYQSQLNAINTDFSGTQKDIKLKELNDKFDTTDIATPISTGTGYKPVEVNVPPPVTLTGNTLLNGANQVVDATWSVYNPLANAALASSTVMGINSLSKGLTGTEADLQATADGHAQMWAGMTDTFNSVLGSKNTDGTYKYFDANGTFQLDKFKTDNAGNTAIMQPFNSLVGLNTYSQTKKQELAQGIYSDKGIQYKAPNSLTQDMFDAGIVNFTPNGVKPEQLVQAGMYQQYLGDTVKKTFKETNTAIAQQNADAATSNARSNASRAALGWKELDFNQDKWKSTQTGSEDMKSSALEKARRIYADLSKLADSTGTISPDKVRQLNVEQLKYLGAERSNTSNAGVTTNSYMPLSFVGSDGKSKETAIILDHGQIKVLRPQEGKTTLEKLPDGRFVGAWDNERSTNITNTATNILNEQLKNAGSKELSSYAPVDYAQNATGTDGTAQDGTPEVVKTNTITESILIQGAKKNKMTLPDYKRSIGL
ncbi:MAG: hypothetical protein ABI091_07510 [Ferruginibacter sp.]